MSLISVEQLLKTGVMHHQAGRLGEAEGLYRQVLGAQPGNAHAQHYLGLLLHQKGDPAGALEYLRRAMALSPADSRYAGNTAQVMLALGRSQEAIDLYRKALGMRPNDAGMHYQLGLAYAQLKQFDQATACYRKAIELKNNHAEAWNCLGLRLAEDNQLVEAMKCYHRAVAANPRLADAHNNAGRLLHVSGKLDEAIAAYQRALELKPNSPGILSNLAAAMKDAGDLDQALALDRQAVALDANNPKFTSNLLYDMLFHPGVTHEELLAEHVVFDQRFCRPLKSKDVHPHIREADGRLRVGYVSPDFRTHPIGRFILPLLQHHDRSRVESFCYSDVRREDAITRACRSAAGVWRETAALSDADLADLIRRDQIDILVDLTMHMEGNRLLVFARKPAPVQVTYLAYCGTTGLSAMDYRLTDEVLDPTGSDQGRYTEQSVRLKSYWCYAGPEDAPDVGPLPLETNGHVTFGSLNHFGKITAQAWAAWVEILQRVPGSRLILHTREGSHRNRVLARVSSARVDPDRIEFVSSLPMKAYLSQYNRIDVGLDPFPYPGGTTTCDALWMGVPVITLPGQTALSRGGLSIYSNLELTGWVAQDIGHYVEMAIEAASNTGELARVRQSLREQMRSSRLMDGPGFAQDMEAAMWRMWEASAK